MWKAFLVALLVAYVVADILGSMMLKKKRPALFQAVMDEMKHNGKQTTMVLLLAAGAGVLTYYLMTKKSK